MSFLFASRSNRDKSLTLKIYLKTGFSGLFLTLVDNMSLHGNWVALSTVDIQWKQFIRENNGPPVDDPKEQRKRTRETLNGSEARDFYLNVISSPSDDKIANKPQLNLGKWHLNDKKSNDESKKQQSRHNTVIQEPTTSLICKFLTAAQNNNVESLTEMYRKCPNILNSVDSFGWTALMCASQSCAKDSMKCLLNWKADIHFKDRTNRTAVSVARSQDIVNLITEYSDDQPVTENDIQGHFEDIHCSFCNVNFKSNMLKQHETSTLHIFHSGGRKHRTYYGIPKNNKGYQLLLRTGWNQEKGLGPDGKGSKFPIKTVLKTDRHGIGASKDIAKVTHFHAKDLSSVSHRKERQRTLNKWQRNKQCSKEKNRERNIRNELA